MAAGDTVTELGKAQSIVIYLNTGSTDADGKPIIDRVTVNNVNPSAQEQAKYDFAYALAGLTSKTVEGIDVRTTTELGPVG